MRSSSWFLLTLLTVSACGTTTPAERTDATSNDVRDCDRGPDGACLGAIECVVTDGACPDDCVRFTLRKTGCVAASSCTGPEQEIICARVQGGNTGGGCTVDVETGTIYSVPTDNLVHEPNFVGFRECTSEERAQQH